MRMEETKELKKKVKVLTQKLAEMEKKLAWKLSEQVLVVVSS